MIWRDRNLKFGPNYDLDVNHLARQSQAQFFIFLSPNLAPDHNLRAKFLIPIPPDHTFRLIPRHVIVKLNLQLPLADLLYLQCSFVRPASVTPPLLSTI